MHNALLTHTRLPIDDFKPIFDRYLAIISSVENPKYNGLSTSVEKTINALIRLRKPEHIKWCINKDLLDVFSMDYILELFETDYNHEEYSDCALIISEYIRTS